MTFVFDNSYARLPERFYARLPPSPVVRPSLIRLNRPLARELGLDPDALSGPDGVAVLAGNRVPEGADPLAMAYAGHQFGNFVPQLGDGRAILLGEILDRSGARFDLQLKGAGRTPFSRAGDGRAWLGPVLREYLISEAMHALGIPTTRALAAVATGEQVYREGPLPGAVLARVARSHVRIGTFEYFSAREDTDGLRQLADYVIDRHYPETRASDRMYLALLNAVIERQADLVARWLGVGFIHGVMNTDNLSIAGETIDYGPCAFMDEYHPGTVYSSIDHAGRYAYGNQPRIAQWNLARLAQTLLPLLDEDPDRALALAQEAIDGFPGRFERAYLQVFRAKLGLLESRDGDGALITALLEGMAKVGADFTNRFRVLTQVIETGESMPGLEPHETDPFADWVVRWRARLAQEDADPDERLTRMRRANPVVIPRNHRVEDALEAAVEGDLDPFEQLLAVLTNPWQEGGETHAYTSPPKPHEVVRQTFCGT
ncbi:protein adenylyltransferase SelO [Imhoffiella purpurea]|uniref:Protein nucleotidyltransferase YdiU n=1 Tax=Imhoffiella purpurea TaxID=1249627 RepID=W9V7P6_9GAMM|nr:YdiU family protein [Imhoffiella purpurea]EXJ15439.1 Selenoprotein O like protein [Imhoffiella purpurea]